MHTNQNSMVAYRYAVNIVYDKKLLKNFDARG